MESHHNAADRHPGTQPFADASRFPPQTRETLRSRLAKLKRTDFLMQVRRCAYKEEQYAQPGRKVEER